VTQGASCSEGARANPPHAELTAHVSHRPARGLGLDFFDRCSGGGAEDGFAALLRGGFGFVGFTGRDDLAVAGLQSEPELARTIFVDLELPGRDASRTEW
jgi:hypothetical protein